MVGKRYSSVIPKSLAPRKSHAKPKRLEPKTEGKEKLKRQRSVLESQFLQSQSRNREHASHRPKKRALAEQYVKSSTPSALVSAHPAKKQKSNIVTEKKNGSHYNGSKKHPSDQRSSHRVKRRPIEFWKSSQTIVSESSLITPEDPHKGTASSTKTRFHESNEESDATASNGEFDAKDVSSQESDEELVSASEAETDVSVHAEAMQDFDVSDREEYYSDEASSPHSNPSSEKVRKFHGRWKTATSSNRELDEDASSQESDEELSGEGSASEVETDVSISAQATDDPNMSNEEFDQEYKPSYRENKTIAPQSTPSSGDMKAAGGPRAQKRRSHDHPKRQKRVSFNVVSSPDTGSDGSNNSEESEDLNDPMNQREAYTDTSMGSNAMEARHQAGGIRKVSSSPERRKLLSKKRSRLQKLQSVHEDSRNDRLAYSGASQLGVWNSAGDEYAPQAEQVPSARVLPDMVGSTSDESKRKSSQFIASERRKKKRPKVNVSVLAEVQKLTCTPTPRCKPLKTHRANPQTARRGKETLVLAEIDGVPSSNLKTTKQWPSAKLQEGLVPQDRTEKRVRFGRSQVHHGYYYTELQYRDALARASAGTASHQKRVVGSCIAGDVVAHARMTEMRALPSDRRYDGEALGRGAEVFSVPASETLSGFVAGTLVLPPGGVKRTEYVRNSTCIYTVVSGHPGSIEVTLGWTASSSAKCTRNLFVSPKDMFRVPSGYTYQIINKSDHAECFMSWTLIH